MKPNLRHGTSWRVSELIGEGWRSVTTGGPGALAVTAIAGIILACTGLLEMTAVDSSIDRVRQIDARGGNTLIAVESADVAGNVAYGGVSVDACRRMAAANEVVAGGPMMLPQPRQIGLRQTTPPSVANLELGTLIALGFSPREDAVFAVSQSLAEELELEEGGRLLLDKHTLVEVSVVGEPGLILDSLQTSAFEVGWLTDEYVDMCVLHTTWTGRDTVARVAAELLPEAGQSLEINPARLGGIYGIDPAIEFGRRATRLGWLVASIAVAVCLSLQIGARRSDLGLYRSLGLRRVELVIVLWTAAAHLVVAAAGIGALAIAWRSFAVGEALATAAGVRALAAGALGSLAGLLVLLPLTTIGSAADQLKDR